MSTQNEWGLTERGFRRPTYTELLDALEYKARELFGSKANLTVRSPIGLFLRIFAWILNMLFSTIEDVYNSRFGTEAHGEEREQETPGKQRESGNIVYALLYEHETQPEQKRGGRGGNHAKHLF